MISPRYYSNRMILHSYLDSLRIRNITKEILLGGGNFDENIKTEVNKGVIKFLRTCNL